MGAFVAPPKAEYFSANRRYCVIEGFPKGFNLPTRKFFSKVLCGEGHDNYEFPISRTMQYLKAGVLEVVYDVTDTVKLHMYMERLNPEVLEGLNVLLIKVDNSFKRVESVSRHKNARLRLVDGRLFLQVLPDNNSRLRLRYSYQKKLDATISLPKSAPLDPAELDELLSL